MVLVLSAFAAVLASPAAAVEPGIVIGARTSGPNIDSVQVSANAGAKWVRLFANWNVLQPTNESSFSSAELAGLSGAVNSYRAAGMKVLIVASGAPAWASGSADPSTPPRDPATYGRFLGKLAAQLRGRVSGWELWNEPDGPEHFKNGPQPATYAALVKSAYPEIKAADPNATVVLGGTVGNNFQFIESLYANGVKGYFDAAAVHTDTACRTAPPEEYYREPDGRIGRFTFIGYREVRAVMLANGDDKPIWMTELGWSSSTLTCPVGAWAGQKPSGVPEIQQADFLTRAYKCLQKDPYVPVALWFSLQDIDAAAVFNHQLGLIRDNGSQKPAFTAFSNFARNPTSATCGVEVDRVAPTVKLHYPLPEQKYLDRLSISATADKTSRLQLFADGVKVPGTQKGGRFKLDWIGARKLSYGRHTITVKAFDEARNVGEVSVVVVKARASEIKVPPASLRFRVARVKAARTVMLSGGVLAPKGAMVKPKGRVRFFFEYKKIGPSGKTSWRLYSRYSKGLKRPFKFKTKMKRPGAWRVYAMYDAEKPYKRVRTPYRTFTVK